MIILTQYIFNCWVNIENKAKNVLNFITFLGNWIVLVYIELNTVVYERFLIKLLQVGLQNFEKE